MYMIFAHRGASGYAPENTMAAFRLALEQGCDGVELDVQMTKDGKVVICHDEAVDRTTNGAGFIKDYTWEELQRFDAGHWFDEKFAGERIPTLDEFLSFVSDKNQTVNIEIKNIPFYYEGIESKIIELITDYGIMENVIISSFDHYALNKVARLNSRIKLGVLFSTRLIVPWKYASQLPFDVYSLHPHFTFVDEEYINQCHSHGYKVYAYTVDKKEWAVPLMKSGMDGFFTNFPYIWK
jgi:glycerophosphoryl diester phosphodiesterase